MSHPRIAAVILAGGLGTRLGGVAKAEIRIGGETLLARATRAVEGIDGPVVVAPGPHHIRTEQSQVADPEGFHGPLAGIAAAAGVECDFLLSVAVDTPFFPPDFAERCLAIMGSADVAVARYEGQAYYTNAVWRRETLAPLLGSRRERLSAGGIKGFVAKLQVAWVDWPKTEDGNPFANVNTPDELAACERRAAEIGVGKAG